MMAKSKKRKLNPIPGAKNSSLRPNTPKAQKQPVAKEVKPTIPFESGDRILLIGEGDFSFAKSIVEHHGCYDVTATCYDSKDDLFEKYKPDSEQNIEYLEAEGQIVLCNIDATKLNSIKSLKKGELFERMIFNFPHVGGKTKDVNRQVRFNQELLVKFFSAGLPLLSPTGTIVVTLFEGEPYTLWNIRDLARHSGLEVQRSFKFVPEAYRGYSHARTLGKLAGGGGWRGEDREARSYVFQKKDGQAVTKGKKRRRGDESSDDD